MSTIKVFDVDLLIDRYLGSGAGGDDTVPASVTQLVTEVLQQATPEVRTTQLAVEALQQPTPEVRATQLAIDVLQQATPEARVTQLAVEIIGKVGAAYTDGGGDHILSYSY